MIACRVPTYAGVLIMAVFHLTALCSQEEIRKKQVELQSLREQIKQYEDKIKEQQREEQSTLELLDSYDQKATLLRTLITTLKKEEGSIQSRIEGTRKEVMNLTDQLTFLKAHYAGYVTSVYRSGRIQDVGILLSSSSINQFFVRAEYLRRFSDQRKEDADRIKGKKKQIEETHARLQIQLGEERRLIAEKGTEDDRLAEFTSERKDVLMQIQKDKHNAQRDLQRKIKAAKDLENLVERLIDLERIKKLKEAEDAKHGLPQPPVVEGTFESRKGSLRWPVSQGTVVARFGNQVHPTLRTVTQNTGIDLSVKPGTAVTAIADGEVSLITWLPSYGNVVIVNHYNGYRTVSTHLAEILVAEGDKIKEGDALGESGESLDGPRLHFEIWKDRDKQNPEIWLGKK